MAKNWHDYTAMTAALSSGADDVLVRDKSDLADNATEGTVRRLGWESLLAVSGITPGGRLTLESGVPVSTTDQTAKGTLYYTPYVHDYVRLYNGTRPTLYTFTERSLALTLTSGKNYDVFLYDNSGTLTLELSAAWTNDTTRADALAWQAGVGYVKSGTATRLWLGTIRASGTNTTEDSLANRFVWNSYNRVRRDMYVHDSTDSWTYTTATWRQKRATATNQLSFVCGLAGGSLLSCVNSMLADNASSIVIRSGIGFDATNAFHPQCNMSTQYQPVNNFSVMMISTLGIAIPLGHHYAAALEYSEATGTTTWYGDAGNNATFKSAISGAVDC